MNSRQGEYFRIPAEEKKCQWIGEEDAIRQLQPIHRLKMQKKMWLARSWIVSRVSPIGDEEQPLLKIQRHSSSFVSFEMHFALRLCRLE